MQNERLLELQLERKHLMQRKREGIINNKKHKRNMTIDISQKNQYSGSKIRFQDDLYSNDMVNVASPFGSAQNTINVPIDMF